MKKKQLKDDVLFIKKNTSTSDSIEQHNNSKKITKQLVNKND
jgi:hypothetical protein